MSNGTITPEDVQEARQGSRVVLSLPSFATAILWATEGKVRLTVTPKQSTLVGEVTQGKGQATTAA